jgi:hypothetical protein
MRNLLSLIGLVVVGFLAIGWYCEWYQLSVSTGTEGKPEIKTIVDTNKVSEDSTTFFKRVGQLIGDKMQEANTKDGPPSDAPGNTPGPVTLSKTGAFNSGWLFSPTTAPKQRP